MKIERRIILEKETELRFDKEKKSLKGYAAVFNSLSMDLGGFREKISPGAFKESLKEADVRALLNHDPNYILGRMSSKTLVISEDDRGLQTEIIPPDTQWARDLVVSIERGDITQMSFGFRVNKDSWERVNEDNIRTLLDVSLVDVSPVTFPAYLDTSIQARSLSEMATVAGLDLAGLEKVLIRATHSIDFDESDRTAIRSVVDVLNKLVAPREIPEDAKLKEQEAQAIRKLNVLSKKFNLRLR
jgi:hypothetical protein